MVTFVSIQDLIYVDNIYLHNFETKEFHLVASPMPIRCEFQYACNDISHYLAAACQRDCCVIYLFNVIAGNYTKI